MSATFAELVLHQFTTDLQRLEVELSPLEMQKRMAMAGTKDIGAARRVDTRVRKLADQLDQVSSMIELLWSGPRATDVEGVRLREAVKGIAGRVGRILAIGQPDRGKGSIAKIVEGQRAKLGSMKKVVLAKQGPQHPTIDLPGVSPTVQADPVLLIAILLDVIRQLILGKKKD